MDGEVPPLALMAHSNCDGSLPVSSAVLVDMRKSPQPQVTCSSLGFLQIAHRPGLGHIEYDRRK